MSGLPWGFTNTTRASGGVVTKTYDGPDAQLRRRAEFAFFTAFRDVLPVPHVLSTVDELELRTAFVPGSVGTDAIEVGQAAWVFTAAGELLRSMSTVDVRALPGEGPVVVHGDFGPQNLLVDPDRCRITAVVDAEWSGRAPEELRDADAAWFEWIIRFHHPRLTTELPRFYAGYGHCVRWPERQALMLRRCREILDFAIRRDGIDGAGARCWRERIERTQDFTEPW